MTTPFRVAPLPTRGVTRKPVDAVAPSAYRPCAPEPVRPSPWERAMADKSPHDNHHARKSGKSIKEKRAERRAKEASAPSSMQRLTTSERDHRRHG